MPSIKQVEAFYWSGQLGSFVAAADRLNTTQSNISKRIQELEYSLGVELFDRSRRTIQMTAKGVALMTLSEELLRSHMKLRQIGRAELAVAGPFRFGVTESVAVTWLARFSSLIKQSFDGLIPISTVDTSAKLNVLLRDRKIDLAIATGNNLDPDHLVVELTEAERVWVASPTLVPGDEKLSAEALAALPMLGHGDRTLQQNLVGRYLAKVGVTPNIVISCASMSALARMAMDGVGITYLHRDVFAADIAAGRLKVVDTEIQVPPVRYVAAYRNDLTSPVAAMVAAKAREACDFSASNQAKP
jgi:DNA-binding transcriptional LysR family regulator